MDIQSLKEFEAWWSENYDRDDFEDVVFSEILNEYESNYIVTDDLNKAWSAWQAVKAQAVPEVITIGNELQSWVAVNSFSADDGEGVLPVVDANAIAEKIEELTGASQ